MGLLGRMKKGGGRGGGGEARVRIQNRSSHLVRIAFLDVDKIDESSSDLAHLSGDVGIDSSLPEHDRGEANGCRYASVFGKAGMFDKGGGVTVEARVPGAGKPTSTLRLTVNDGEWGWEDVTPDGDSPIKLVADASESESEAGAGIGGGRCRRWKVELRVYDNVDTARWMEVLGGRIGDLPLNQLGLPGTHDSGTYAFDRDMGASPDSDLTKTIERFCPIGGIADAVLDKIFRRLCQCQTKTMLEQLQAGVRYLDLRIARHAGSGRYYTCHGVYCADMSAAMKEIGTFLTNHPKEIVVLDFNHLYEMDGHHAEFLRMVFDALGDKAASPRTTSAVSRVSEYWSRNKQAIVIYHASSDAWKDAPFANRVYHGGYVHSPWPEANDTDELRAKLGSYVDSRHDDENRNRLFVLQGMLTPDVELIKSGLMRGDGPSTREYARLASPAVLDWCAEEWMTTDGRDARGGGSKNEDAAAAAGKKKGEKRRFNIVIVDFIEGVSIIPAIIDYNRRR